MESSRNLNAFITETPELALKSADLSDKNFANQILIGHLRDYPWALRICFVLKMF